MIKKYKKKPIVIEAIEYTGLNIQEIQDFIKSRKIVLKKSYGLIIPTLEGDMIASQGDFIIKGIGGEFYPCKPDIFKETYDEVQ